MRPALLDGRRFRYGMSALPATRIHVEDHRRFRALVEQISDVLCLLDETGRITYVSPSLTRVLGYTPEERLGHSAFELL